MYTGGNPSSSGSRILVVRLGAMGDIIHTLPAVASLKHSFPGSHLTWAVEPRWAALLDGNPFIDNLLFLQRGNPWATLGSCRELRKWRFDFAVDFQGLLKSALLASVARPERIYGFHQSQVRERAAALFYSNKTVSKSIHVVDKALDLAAAAGAGSVVRSFHLPQGAADGTLPGTEFVLGSPLAGWPSKQWPLEYWRELAVLLRRELGIPLVLNGLPEAKEAFGVVPEAYSHLSGLPGLIHATRRAIGVVGVDSGPLHLAAALAKPGVAIFGPTDPARNGPYGETFTVLRSLHAATTYKRRSVIDPSMRQIQPDVVFRALKARLTAQSSSAGCSA